MLQQHQSDNEGFVSEVSNINTTKDKEAQELNKKIKSLEEDLVRLVAELKDQSKRSKQLKEDCEDKVAKMEQQEHKLRAEMLEKENDLKKKLMTEGLKLQALNEKEYREMEKKYMRDFSAILGIDQPQQMVDYTTFVEMVRSKVQRMNTKIEMLMGQREPLKITTSSNATQGYLDEAERIKRHGLPPGQREVEKE